MKYGLIGERLSHSFSRIIHQKIGGYGYGLYEIPPKHLDSFLKRKEFLGINVTIPYKEAVIPYLDFIDEPAKRIGAVNTIVNRDGKLCGYNTDYYGLKALFIRANIDPKGKKAVILGSGGTSKTALAVLTDLGASSILRVSRYGKGGAITYEELLTNHFDARIIVNTTPSGMFPDVHQQPVSLEGFKQLEGVIDVIYNPLNTSLTKQAKSMGIKSETGLYMLVEQAVRASELFRDVSIPKSETERIFDELRREKENIVLIGMPASGKSTVGKILAERLGRRLVDTDELIEEQTSMSIKDYFERYGEDEFRRLESEVIKELSKETSLIISTGGGAILRVENISALKYNGKLFFIDRPLEKLIPTDSRPLSSSREAIKARYNERYSIYCNCCDVRIDADREADEVADKIMENL